ncbi:MAG TPA: hypothetical protein DHW02_12110 [Ktedonobacter sp.]|nr:hypothetical protein [Ktedonobacter sp.]
MRTTTLLRRIIGVVLLLVIAYIHFMIIKTGFRLQEYLGVLFILDVIGAIVSALWIAIFDAVGGCILGRLIVFGSVIGYVLTRTVHFPGLHKLLPWRPVTDPGIISLVVEVIVVLLALSVLGRSTTGRVGMA